MLWKVPFSWPFYRHLTEFKWASPTCILHERCNYWLIGKGKEPLLLPFCWLPQQQKSVRNIHSFYSSGLQSWYSCERRRRKTKLRHYYLSTYRKWFPSPLFSNQKKYSHFLSLRSSGSFMLDPQNSLYFVLVFVKDGSCSSFNTPKYFLNIQKALKPTAIRGHNLWGGKTGLNRWKLAFSLALGSIRVV